jgi:hypothetical protein
LIASEAMSLLSEAPVAPEILLEPLVFQIIDEWNKAEKAIKIAEQVNGEIINPAIYELRYAARRCVEAAQEYQNNNPRNAAKLLHDAHFDCCRARHDAIDAATSKISNDLSIAVRKIGGRVIYAKFPNYAVLVKELKSIRSLVASSREARENRDAIYETIAGDNLVKIVDLYSEFQACEEILKDEGRYSRLKTILGILGWVVATAIAIYSALHK